jgi:hypothetical protein
MEEPTYWFDFYCTITTNYNIVRYLPWPHRWRRPDFVAVAPQFQGNAYNSRWCNEREDYLFLHVRWWKSPLIGLTFIVQLQHNLGRGTEYIVRVSLKLWLLHNFKETRTIYSVPRPKLCCNCTIKVKPISGLFSTVWSGQISHYIVISQSLYCRWSWILSWLIGLGPRTIYSVPRPKLCCNCTIKVKPISGLFHHRTCKNPWNCGATATKSGLLQRCGQGRYLTIL